MPTFFRPPKRLGLLTLVAAWLLAPLPPATAAGNPLNAPTTVWVLTHDHQLVQVAADSPSQVRQRVAVHGLPAGDALVGIDYRVARGVLYALGRSGQLYTLDTATGRVQPVGPRPAAALTGTAFGFDFNPAADRIRVVSDTGQNLRLHPDTGALAATDPTTHRAGPAGQAADPVGLTAAAYTYNTRDASLTTNYAIVPSTGTLVLQGSREGTTPPVSPNTGQLFPVGPLHTGPLATAAFDIADVSNRALAALRVPDHHVTELYQIHLDSGRATRLGALPVTGAVRGLAIEP